MGVGHHTFAAEIGTWLDSNRLDLYGWLVGCLRVGTMGQCSTLILLSELDPFHFGKKKFNKQTTVALSTFYVIVQFPHI